MAKITITADASNAKKELDNLRKKLKDTHKEADKPIRPRVTPGGTRGGGGGGAGAITATPGAGAMGATIGKTGKLASSAIGAVGAANIGGAASGILSALGPWGMVAAAGVALASQFEEVKSVFAQIGAATGAFFNAGKTSAERGANADSLDDRAARSGATAAEQFATEEARKNEFGTDGNAIFDKISNAIISAANGDEKAINNLTSLGLYAKSFEGMSELQKQDLVLSKLAESFKAAQATGNQANTNAVLQQVMNLAGARNANEARKIISGDRFQSYTARRDSLRAQFEQAVPQSAMAATLAANSRREDIDSAAKIQSYIVPETSRIIDHANRQLAEKESETSGLYGRQRVADFFTAGSPKSEKAAADTAANTSRTNDLLEQIAQNQNNPQPAVYQ